MCDDQVLTDMFNTFDADKSGFVSQGELEALFTKIAEAENCGITKDDISSACEVSLFKLIN